MKNESRDYKHNNHSVGMATVHLVWIPKRRKPVLVGKIRVRLAQILNEVAAERDWIIKALEIAPDHVHILVEYDPKTPINSVVKAFKGRSSRLLRQEFPELLKLPTLWTHAYFYDTTGKISSAIIQEYINDPHHSK
ncbi:transposase IS200-family protein [Gloeothece citriformis PCC 7424]|uniref:Transposase IS200-family protein n=1 Tax=Gloeothece citriformis (strain PCC 7424) TaxID=65393 RepID=B7K8F2_GLOC7|nr:IS200/IS605 family transposase [Gloeothece citriformis]ACK69912.1 transposase IS200-family protein [Gloeothece citriformis PCC 7424]ACK73630.1 transposase IS200-family protein [Gloeothece citriformis PCC 7424]